MRGFICTAKGLADSDYHRTGIVGLPCECSFGVTATHNFTAILGCRFSITATTFGAVFIVHCEHSSACPVRNGYFRFLCSKSTQIKHHTRTLSSIFARRKRTVAYRSRESGVNTGFVSKARLLDVHYSLPIRQSHFVLVGIRAASGAVAQPSIATPINGEAHHACAQKCT